MLLGMHHPHAEMLGPSSGCGASSFLRRTSQGPGSLQFNLGNLAEVPPLCLQPVPGLTLASMWRVNQKMEARSCPLIQIKTLTIKNPHSVRVSPCLVLFESGKNKLNSTHILFLSSDFSLKNNPLFSKDSNLIESLQD